MEEGEPQQPGRIRLWGEGPGGDEVVSGWRRGCWPELGGGSCPAALPIPTGLRDQMSPQLLIPPSSSEATTALREGGRHPPVRSMSVPLFLLILVKGAPHAAS